MNLQEVTRESLVKPVEPVAVISNQMTNSMTDSNGQMPMDTVDKSDTQVPIDKPITEIREVTVDKVIVDNVDKLLTQVPIDKTTIETQESSTDILRKSIEE